MTPGNLESLLYKRRIDLWAVTKVLRYCKGKPYRSLVWDSLTDEDKDILTEINEGRMPSAFQLRAGEPS